MKSPWSTKKLGEICDFIFGYAFPSNRFNKDNKGLPIIKTGDIKNNFCENFYNGDYEEKYLVRIGDILIGLSGTIISGRWKGETALLNQRVVKLFNFSKDIDKNFVFYILPILHKDLENQLWKAAVKNVLKHHLENLQISIPPLPIQQKIVYILDTIQEAIEVQEKIIEKTKELKKSLMADLFKYGGPSFRQGRKLKKTEIGEIPENWEVVKLGDEKISKIKYGKAKPSESGNIVVVGSSGIYENTNKTLIEKPTIVIGRKGSAGLTHLILSPCWPSDTTFYLDLNLEIINPIFLYTYFLFRPLSGDHSKTTLPSLKREDLENYFTTIPPLPEQREIAEILQTVDQKIEIEEKKKTLYEELFKTMFNKLMKQEIDVESLQI